jgi:hypothetical protein
LGDVPVASDSCGEAEAVAEGREATDDLATILAGLLPVLVVCVPKLIYGRVRVTPPALSKRILRRGRRGF